LLGNARETNLLALSIAVLLHVRLGALEYLRSLLLLLLKKRQYRTSISMSHVNAMPKHLRPERW
jgi:hypothetical protein